MLFSNKKTSLFDNNVQTSSSKNAFLQMAGKESSRTLSYNGSEKYDTTGNDFVDQFANLSKYRAPRDYASIAKDSSILWSQDSEMAMKFILFMRTITRKPKMLDGTVLTDMHRGSGLKHESIMRMMWVAINHPETFKANIDLFIVAGSWKDIFRMLELDLVYHGWNDRCLNWDFMYEVISIGLGYEGTRELVLKYLPSYKAKSKAKTVEAQAKLLIVKWLVQKLFGKFTTESDKISKYTQYQKLKSSGKAHEWQQLISKGLVREINFNKIPGRALQLLVNSKFLNNQNLESTYEEWMNSQPVLKYTGYVHELFQKVNSMKKTYEINTLNKQFLGLIETAKDGINTNTGLIVVRDTSGSMTSPVPGCNMSAFDVAKSLALYFSYMLPDGYFADSFLEFNSYVKLHKWRGSTPYEKYVNDYTSAYASTDFQKVIDLFINLRNQGVPESEFPSGILCISDGELNRYGSTSNFETAQRKISENFSAEYVDNFKIILWDVPNGYYGGREHSVFETYGDVENVFYLSGYDGSILSFLTGAKEQTTQTPQTAEELFVASMNQELLNKIEIVD